MKNFTIGPFKVECNHHDEDTWQVEMRMGEFRYQWFVDFACNLDEDGELYGCKLKTPEDIVMHCCGAKYDVPYMLINQLSVDDQILEDELLSGIQDEIESQITLWGLEKVKSKMYLEKVRF